MRLRPVDEVVAWRTDERGRPIAYEGTGERCRIGPFTRFLLPELDGDFAAPGDLVRLFRLPVRGTPMAAIVNFTAGRAAVSPVWRRLVPAFFIIAIAFILDVSTAADGSVILGGILAGALPGLALRLAADKATSMTSEAWSYRARVHWQLARHLLAPGRPRPSETPSEEPDWEERLRLSWARALPGHEWREIAELSIPDGRLVAADPYDVGEGRYGVIEVPPGTYPVVLAFGHFGPPSSGLSETRAVHAWLALGEGEAARWEPVLDRAGSEYFVGVDSATAAFTAEGSIPTLLAAYDDGSRDGFASRLESFLLGAMRSSPWAVLEAGEARMAIFESGYGDGFYPVYRGFDEAGALVALAIDFRVAESIYFSR
jgi:hypothetical protein